MTQAAVLTGDLIGSTEAGPEAVDRAMSQLGLAARIFERHAEQPIKFTRSRGDGWQMILVPAVKYMRVTAYVLAALRSNESGLQTRIGIGIGAVISQGKTDLSDAYGPAFVRSGQALEQLNHQDRLAILGLDESEARWSRAALETLDYLSTRWSIEQAAAIAGSLTGAKKISLTKRAEHLKISRQALSSRLAVAGEKPIMAAIRAAEATL